MRVLASNQFVGIGTTNPAANLSVYSAGGNPQMSISDGTVTYVNGINTGAANITAGTTSNHPLHYITNNSYAMSILGSGNIGIGTITPNSKLSVIGEIDFTSGHDVSTHIEINLPELSLYNFVPCENTILATKNADVETFVKVRLEPGKLHLYSYPFDPDTKYEFNIQLFMRKILDINK